MERPGENREVELTSKASSHAQYFGYALSRARQSVIQASIA